MSLEEAERALIDLLFDESLRRSFAARPAESLAAYELTQEERSDFLGIDPHMLEFDAKMRRDLLLARLARTFPLSFSITSSLPGGLDIIKRLAGAAYVRAPRGTRTARYGQSLREELRGLAFPRERERVLCGVIVEVEVSMAWAAAELRERALQGKAQAEVLERPQPGWDKRPLRLAPHLCIAMLPSSHATLKKELCPFEVDQLWARLERMPLPAARLSAVLAQESPRLFLGRAVLERASRCEATVTHRIVEMNEGFAPLVHMLDGTRSAQDLLGPLARGNASATLLDSVRQGFRKLVERGMATPT